MMFQTEIASEALMQKRLKKKQSDQIHTNILNEIKQETISNLENDEKSKEFEIRSLKATIKRLEKIIENYKLLDEKREIITQISENDSKENEIEKEKVESENSNESSSDVPFIKQIFIETILDNLSKNYHEYPLEFVSFCYYLYSISPHCYC